MHKKLLAPAVFMALTSVGLRAMDEQQPQPVQAEKDKQEVTGLDELTVTAAFTFEEFEAAHPHAAQVALAAYKLEFAKRVQQKSPGLVSSLRTRAQSRSGLKETLEGAVTQVQGLQTDAAAAMATAGVLADMFQGATGVDLKAAAAEAGTDIKSLVQQGVQAALAELKGAEQTGCWGRCKKKSAAANATK